MCVWYHTAWRLIAEVGGEAHQANPPREHTGLSDFALLPWVIRVESIQVFQTSRSCRGFGWCRSGGPRVPSKCKSPVGNLLNDRSC